MSSKINVVCDLCTDTFCVVINSVESFQDARKVYMDHMRIYHPESSPYPNNGEKSMYLFVKK